MNENQRKDEIRVRGIKIRMPNIIRQQNRWIEIPDYGQIGAGTVVPFPTDEDKKKTIRIPMPSNARDGDVLFSHTVSGDSLHNYADPKKHLCDGDSLICKANIELHNIKPDKICIVFISQTCEKLAKHVILDGDKVILRSTNPKYADRRFPVDVVEIKGIVIGYKRLWE